MGTVWRAWDERLKRQVAIKNFRPDSKVTDLRQRLWREAQTAAQLNHPAIVQIYDLVESPAGHWIVMELVEGRTIRKLIQEEGRLPVEQAVRLGLAIAEGLAEAHSHGVLHRDLKAANVMVTPAGRAKILDFGLAKQLAPAEDDEEQDASASGIVVGTSYAMSPEQVLGKTLDARSDLFSLGSLLYEMLTGEPPFRAANLTASMAAILSLHPPPLVEVRPDVPVELSDLVNRLLQKDLRFRLQSADEVLRLLSAFAGAAALTEEGQPSTVAEPVPFRRPASEPSGSPSPRSWWYRAAGLMFVGVLLPLGVWLYPRFLARPESYTVHVQVLDPKELPAAGATLHASAGEMHPLADGTWEVRIPASKVPADGRISLHAVHKDWEPYQGDLVLDDDPKPQATIRLKVPLSWIRGQVADADERPLSGVRVSRQDGAPGEAVTNADGRFALELTVPRDTRVRLRSEREGWPPGDDFCYAGRDDCYIALGEQ